MSRDIFPSIHPDSICLFFPPLILVAGQPEVSAPFSPFLLVNQHSESQRTSKSSLQTVWRICCLALQPLSLTYSLKGLWKRQGKKTAKSPDSMGSRWHQRKLVTPPAPVFVLSSLSLSLPSSQWPLSSPFLTGRGVQLLTYKIWSLSTCVERHGEWWWWWDHTINDLEKGKSVLGGVREGERRKWLVNGWCVDVFQMLMCHFRTKEKVHE